MAVFYSNQPYDYQAPDLDQFIRTLSGTTQHGGGSINGFHVGSSLSVLEGFAITLPTFTFQSALLVNWGGGQLQLGGNNFSYSGSGALAGGSVNFVFGIDGSGRGMFGLADVSISASQLWSALHTATDTDDMALLAAVFSGDDAVALSPFVDVFAAGGGVDLVSGLGGNDRLLGQDGDDHVDGGAGLDNLSGGLGNDILAGGTERDRLFGGTGSDILFGGRGSDRMTGGTQGDFFMADRLGGVDVITDFGNGVDRIVLLPGADTRFADLAITQDGNDALVNYTNGTIRLIGVNAASLTRNQFLFDVDVAIGAQMEQFSLQWDYWDLMA